MSETIMQNLQVQIRLKTRMPAVTQACFSINIHLIMARGKQLVLVSREC